MQSGRYKQSRRHPLPRKSEGRRAVRAPAPASAEVRPAASGAGGGGRGGGAGRDRSPPAASPSPSSFTPPSGSGAPFRPALAFAAALYGLEALGLLALLPSWALVSVVAGFAVWFALRLRRGGSLFAGLEREVRLRFEGPERPLHALEDRPSGGGAGVEVGSLAPPSGAQPRPAARAAPAPALFLACRR